MNTPKLSLCMLAGDDAGLLPDFLQATRGLYDELIAVDTGLSPAGLTLLQQVGATIVDHMWQDDGAKARNAGLDAASGTWILQLDAAEVPDAELVQSVRHLSQQADIGAASLCLRQTLEAGHVTTSYPVRLFRAHLQTRYTHPVCEDVAGAVLDQLDASGQRLARLQGEVHVALQAPDGQAAQTRTQAKHAQLRALVDAHPEDFYNWFRLLDGARMHHDIEAWTDAAYELDAVLSAHPDDERFDAWYMGEMLVLVAEGMFAGDDAQLLSHLRPWEARIRPSAAFLLRRGELNEATGHIEQAQADYLRCVDLRQMTPNAQLATVRPLLGLSRLSMLRGDNATALELVDVALTESPRDPEALLALTTLTHALGGAETTARVVEAYIESHGDTTELRAALGEAALRAGDSAGAIRELEQATSMAPGGRANDLLEQARSAAAEPSA